MLQSCLLLHEVKNIFYMKTLLLSLAVVFAAFSASSDAYAENYPYRSDFLWNTAPSHADWLYAVGEEASIEVSLYKYGIAQNVKVDYEVAFDMLDAYTSGSFDLQEGKYIINIGTRQTPGFLDLRLSATVEGQKTQHHIKVGFSVDQIFPSTQEPSDFQSFWSDAVERMRRVPLTYTLEAMPELSTDAFTCQLAKVMLNEQKQCVYAYIFIPREAKLKSCPAVLCPPGAGIKTIKEPLRHRYYAENGCIRMEMEIHGLDPRLPQEAFDQMMRAFNGKENGYLANGIENRDRYYMKRVYLALVRCLDLLTSLPEWDGKNLAVQGGSQGGALSIVAAALDQRVTQCIVNHPALSDMSAYNEGLTGGYPHFNRIEGFFTSDVLATIPYYDVVNFARHVKAKTYMTWGYNDNVCPPTTSYAVWNVLACPKELLLTPVNEHWTSEAVERGHLDWLLRNLK